MNDERRADMIEEEYNDICEDSGLMEDVIIKYASDLAGEWINSCLVLHHGKHDGILTAYLASCISREAEGNVDNRISRGEL